MTDGHKQDDDVKTRAQLIKELVSLRRRVAEVEGPPESAWSLQAYRSMVSASRDFMMLVDSTYTYRATNQAYCDELRRTPDEIIGHSVADIFGEEVFENTLKPRFDRCLAGESVSFDIWWNSPARGRRHVDVRYDPSFEEGGSVSGVLVDVRDTTEQALTKEKLERSVAALEVANQDLEAFSNSLAHDLRTPLLTLTNFGYYLDEAVGDSLDEEQQKNLQRIRHAGEQAMHIIDDLRVLADVSRAEIRRDEVDITSMARQIIDDLSQLAPDREVSFEPEPNITAVGDAALLRLMLTNLLQNAWKYSGLEDEARIELGVEHVEGSVPVYHVRDNGVGFDNAQNERIFRAFERLDTGGQFTGSGLGLATVERTIHRHGGRVWAEGSPGQGSVFRFTLAPAWTAAAGVAADRRSRDRP